jgi:hypothetical protein
VNSSVIAEAEMKLIFFLVGFRIFGEYDVRERRIIKLISEKIL